MPIKEVGMAEIGSFFLVGCNPSRVLGFGVLGSSGFWVLGFFFFFSFFCDRCVKEEMGMPKIGGDWWVSGFGSMLYMGLRQ